MDTRLKTTHKKKNLIIALCILVPAIILTSLYPAMEKAATKKHQEIEREAELIREQEPDTCIREDFVNYAVEASYYMYALMDKSENDGAVLEILNEYGWREDYYFTTENTEYYLECDGQKLSNYKDGNLKELLTIGKNNKRNLEEELDKRGIEACLVLQFDDRGNVINSGLFASDKYGEMDNVNTMEKVNASIEQFENNATYWEYSVHVEPGYGKPKNFAIVYTITSGSEFIVQNEWETPYYSYEQIYLSTGAFVLVLVMAAFVAILALILPFFKSLNTGRERIFSLPLEIMICICGISIGGAFFMAEFMCHYNSMEWFKDAYTIEFLGVAITPEVAYAGYLILSFLGWTVCFFTEYVTIASLRQFLCGPRTYMKTKLLSINILKVVWKKAKGFFKWMSSICGKFFNIRFEELNRGLIKLTTANTLILIIPLIWYCYIPAGWCWEDAIFFALSFSIPYTVLFYIFIFKYMKKVKEQHDVVLDATTQIADGNFKIVFDEDLGPFTQIGNELERVQEGFAKAVAEEAKSQNMKSELITNVSHDLKTPLTAIITYVDLLGKEGITEEERKSYLATLEQKSQRLKMLIEDLFEVSKANSGNMKLDLMDVDVVNLMKEVRLEMEDKIKESTLDFKWNLPEEKVILHLDGRKTYRIFTNLLNNILKYAMEHTRVYVDVKEDLEKVSVIFRNISAKELNFDVERLTDRFVRGDEARNTEGSGLGLAIVKSFVELQGGTFKIETDGDLFKATIIWKK